MSDRRNLIRAAILLLGLGVLGACAAPDLLPGGPTPIPTLIPVSDQTDEGDTSEVSFVLQSYPAQLPSASKGYEVYQDLCLECHGPNGTGVVPGARDFRDLDFMRGETPLDFYAAVTEGRSEMPAYSESLSSDERWDVVFYIWRLSTSPEIIVEGSELYATNCSPCHGEDGAGEQLDQPTSPICVKWTISLHAIYTSRLPRVEARCLPGSRSYHKINGGP